MSAAPGVRPRLRRSVDPRLTIDGRAYLLRGPEHEDLELEGDPSELGGLLRLADGSRTVAALHEALAARGHDLPLAAVDAAVQDLVAVGVLDDAAEEAHHLDARERERYQRQLAYFADLLGSARDAARAERRLIDSRVCILGLGGLGSWAAWALACAGVRSIVGVDCDRLELSNLNRQVLYGEADIGRWKADAAGEALRRFDLHVDYTPVRERLDSPDAVARVVADADLVLDSLDTPPLLITRWVNAACFARGVPVLAMSQHPPKLRIGPLYVPGGTGCFACQEAGYRERYPLYDVLERSEQVVPPSATFGPACGAVGTLAANEAVAHLAGLHEPATLGSALIYDLRSGDVERERVPARRECRICGPLTPPAAAASQEAPLRPTPRACA